jgi:hypothetical protein
MTRLDGPSSGEENGQARRRNLRWFDFCQEWVCLWRVVRAWGVTS